MMRITTIATLWMLFYSSTIFAQLNSGKAYRIESVAAPGKALMTMNSSLDDGASVVLWTKTDVASECWTANIISTVGLRNAYSNIPFVATSASANAKVCQSRTGNGRWVIETCDAETGIYKLKCSTKALYVTIPDTINGTQPVLAEAIDDNTQLWHIVEVEPKTSFTPVMREEMMDAYIASAVETMGTHRKTFGGGSWSESEQLEVLLDAYETTGREDYLDLAKEIYIWYNANVGVTWTKLVYTDNYHWFGHDFNDDVMWQVIAVTRLGLLSHNQTYINVAKRNFDAIYNRAYIPFTGLLRWAQESGDPYSTNACIAGPAEVAACYLGFAGCGEQYFQLARDLYAAHRQVLTNNMETGKVWDNVVWNPDTELIKSKNEWASTYNQGTMLGAACMLYKYYGDEQYLKDAKKIMSWTKMNLCDSHGIINVCQGGDNHDLWGFKGILMRYVRRLIRDCGVTSYQEWMEKNALHAYCNRTVDGITPTAWLQKGNTENTADDFGNSTAASAAVNVMFSDDPGLPYDENAKDPDNPAGIVVAPTSAEQLSIYDLSGRKIVNQSHPKSICIVRQGNSSKKIIR